MDSQQINTFKRLRKLLSIEGLGIMRILKLVELFGSVENIFRTNLNEKSTTQNLHSKIKLAQKEDSNFDKMLDKEIETLEKIGAKIITFMDENYPQQLKNIYYPPLILYTLGEITEPDSKSISVVGTRQTTDYGRTIANKIVSSLAKQNITIVSGLARGIDSVAHKTALKNGGRTIAIIGSGLDVIYPPENKYLFNQIIENGAVISEFTLGTKPDAQNFPKRNRIIAGFSLGTLVVETRLNGGAMQTAKYAIDQNREVFAIPGNLTSEQSVGTNSLIKKNGAKLVQDADDILVELKLKLKPQVGINIPKPDVNLSIFEQKIYDALSSDPIHIDAIAIKTSLSVSDCLISLLSLEFMGKVQQLPGKMFCKI